MLLLTYPCFLTSQSLATTILLIVFVFMNLTFFLKIPQRILPELFIFLHLFVLFCFVSIMSSSFICAVAKNKISPLLRIMLNITNQLINQSLNGKMHGFISGHPVLFHYYACVMPLLYCFDDSFLIWFEIKRVISPSLSFFFFKIELAV